MNGDEPYAQAAESPTGLALILLALALNFFLIFNALMYWGGLKNQVRQNDALTQQILQGRQTAANARMAQGMLEGLANDLLVLSTSDADARHLIEKYQIRRMSPTPAAK
ncbi:MAG: hypothetical protein IT578_06390 [Verrucomicrobiae bacterium]|nr:hypothetical protein [Verrucomicrobiae bacterium]